MKLLLDTHALLWFLQGDERLSANARNDIVTAGPVAAVRIASLWEIAIKMSLGKLTLPRPFKELFPSSIVASNLSLLNIGMDHLARLSTLPFHHRDPFDRLLIAQATVDDLELVTRDSHFANYGIRVVW